MKSQTPAPCSSIPAWAVTCTDYSTGNKVCWLRWQPCDDPHVYHVAHLIHYFSLLFSLFVRITSSESATSMQVLSPWAHGPTDAHYMQARCSFFPQTLQRKQQQQRSTVVTSVVGQAGQPTLFTHGRHFRRHFVLLHFSKEEGCGSFKAHTGGNTGSNLSLSTPCPICINSYVTMVSVYNGLSSTAAVRGTGTETGNAHGWKS